MPTIFLLNGVSSFPNPGDWNPVNKVECLGSGFQGGVANAGSPLLAADERDTVEPLISRNPGGGGGGGAYAYGTNLTPTFPVTVNVAAKNNYFNGYSTVMTYWQNANVVTGAVCASNGGGSLYGQGGAGGASYYPTGYNGGRGGNGSASFGGPGGGAGGAAGPHGVGGDGGPITGPEGGQAPGAGGSGDYGNTQGGVTGTGGLNNGRNGTQWDATHGCGGGGCGGEVTVRGGGSGGLYGGGGGGQGGDSTAPGVGTAQDGLMVIIYTSYIPPPLVNSGMIM